MLLRKIEFRALTTQILVALCLALAFCSLPMVAKGQDAEAVRRAKAAEARRRKIEDEATRLQDEKALRLLKKEEERIRREDEEEERLLAEEEEDRRRREEDLCQIRKDQQRCIKVFVNVLDTDTVKDVFGRRIGNRFIAIQVTITNRSADFQYLVHDVSLDLKEIFIQPLPREKPARYAGQPLNERDRYRYELSSLELSLMRGVAERGQALDPRNIGLRVLNGIGTIAAGLIGVQFGGNTYPEGVATFNGPFISAYREIFPDFTINQVNRLNDSSYRTNRLVPKQQAVVMVAFIPQKMFLDERQRKVFKKDPLDLMTYEKHPERAIDLRRIEAAIQGDWITEVRNLPLTVTTVQIDADEMQKFQTEEPEVTGYVSGQGLTNAKIALVNPDPDTLITVEKDESKSTTDRLFFTLKSSKPVPPNTRLTFQVSDDQNVQKHDIFVSYNPIKPTITNPDALRGEAGKTVEITLTGTNFIPGKTKVNTSDDSVVKAVAVKDVTSTSMKVTFEVKNGTEGSTSEVRVVILETIESDPATFNVIPQPTDGVQ